jgi:hypothetical protein
MINHMNKAHEQLHEIESTLIQIYGLMEALQIVLPDGDAHTCVANALEDRLRCLQQQFYQHWDTIFAKPQNQDKVKAPKLKAQSQEDSSHH